MGFRLAREADLDELVLIERGCPGAPQWSRAQLERGLRSARARLLVLEEEGRLLAFAEVAVAPPDAELTTIVVRRSEQGRGLGRAMLGRVVEEALAAGCERLSLEVGQANAPAAALYASAGFKAVGRRPRYYDDGSDAVLMDLALG
ncbi:MAG: ribosomal protein S18-alanine N-acetyltransferase [Elusimicrobia bacterium]|nr:ribosomal protein S18-alanine N-acetyltransferase [Elusimicrobiota bacterium]